MTSAAQNTKDALVATAHRLFAERGYDGVSIAEIAGTLGITKQALLHHFGSKEKLYGLVLEDLSKRFDAIVQPHLKAERPAREQFLAILGDLYRHMNAEKHDARLIVRELLDNQPRIAEKQRWYLRPFLETLSDLMRQIPEGDGLSKTEAFARTFQIVGAVNYFAISDPTLKKMLGDEAYADVESRFLGQLEALFLKP
ncbi:MAG: TetR/AcrR family transcriptional regulator [Pseudomonadota bacterium]